MSWKTNAATHFSPGILKLGMCSIEERPDVPSADGFVYDSYLAVSKIMETVLNSKGQMTLSIAARRRLRLDAGDRGKVRVDEATGSIELMRAGNTGTPLLGLLKRPTRALSVEQMDAGLARHLKQKHSA